MAFNAELFNTIMSGINQAGQVVGNVISDVNQTRANGSSTTPTQTVTTPTPSASLPVGWIIGGVVGFVGLVLLLKK